MARYIDAEALKERIEYYYTHTGDQRTNAEHYAYGVALREINEQPTADVVEVVKCKDCKRYYPKNHEERVGWCEKIGINMPYEHFCSYGERKVK